MSKIAEEKEKIRKSLEKSANGNGRKTNSKSLTIASLRKMDDVFEKYIHTCDKLQVLFDIVEYDNTHILLEFSSIL